MEGVYVEQDSAVLDQEEPEKGDDSAMYAGWLREQELHGPAP
jgi:hypothetical protein